MKELVIRRTGNLVEGTRKALLRVLLKHVEGSHPAGSLMTEAATSLLNVTGPWLENDQIVIELYPALETGSPFADHAGLL